MKLTVAAKRIGDKWEGALVVDGKFQRALVEPALEAIVMKGLVALLVGERPEGTDVLIEAGVEVPGDKK